MNAALRISLSSTILWLVFMFMPKSDLSDLIYFFFRINKRFAHAPNPSGNAFRRARKCQTLREMTFAMRGNVKPFRKRLSPCAEMPNLSGNNFRHARKCQTTRETTFAVRGNVKPLGKRLSPCAEMPNLLGNDFRRARKCQTIRETTFAKRGNAKPLGK